MRFASASLAVIALALAAPAAAQDRAKMSAPQALPIADPIPAARDIPYPGTMTLDVDATDIVRGVYDVKQTVPVSGAGRLTLLYPEWLPGKHGPRGAIAELVDLRITANGKPVKWVRDSYDVYAFHVDVPAGAKQLDLAFKFLTPLDRSQGRIVVTPEMMNLQFEQVSLYPAGYYTRQIKVRPTITLPAGWTAATALDGGVARATSSGNRVAYGVTDYETLVDSPVFAGKYFRKWDLGHDVTLNVVADEAKNLEMPANALAQHKRLVAESLALFGARHFDHYEFLLALTDKLGGIGLEHHRSSENSREPDFFTDYDNNQDERGLLPHEFTHSWNGKFRRPAGLWTPDYRTPMKDNLLWVYEGQTSYLGSRPGGAFGGSVEGGRARRLGPHRRLLFGPAGSRVALGRGHHARSDHGGAQAQAEQQPVARRGLLQRRLADLARRRHEDPRTDRRQEIARRLRQGVFRHARRRLGRGHL